MTRSIAALLALGLLTPALFVLVATDETAVADDGPSSPLPWADAEFDTSGPFSRVPTPGPYGIGPDEVYELSSDEDGAVIQVGIVRPIVPEGTQVPIIAMATVYFADFEQVALRDACRTPVVSGPESAGPCRFDVGFLIDNYVPHGYAVALIPTRGSGGSGGCFEVGGRLEVADLDQAVTWMAEQQWSTGKVGMIGMSYGGWAAWEVASTGNPHLRTIVPLAGLADQHDWAVRNGTVFRPPGQAPTHVLFGLGVQQPTPVERRPDRACPTIGDMYKAAAITMTDPYADPTGFWAERDLRPAVLARYDGSVLSTWGTQDKNVAIRDIHPFLDAVRAKGSLVHEVYGPWDHFPPDSGGSGDSDAPSAQNPDPRWDWAEQLLRWFDHELKGIDVDMGPAVQIADAAMNWRAEDSWPPTDATWTTIALEDLDLANEGFFAPVMPTLGAPGFEPFRGIQLRTDPLEEDLRFTGAPRVSFEVTPRAPAGQVMARIADATTGTSFGWGIMDLAYRNGGTEPVPVVAGERIPVQLELHALDGYVPAGHSLEVAIEFNWYQLQAQHILPVDIHPVGALQLPVITRTTEDLFELPWE